MTSADLKSWTPEQKKKFFANKKGIAKTLSARYYKDGAEILIDQGEKNPRRLTPRECARIMGFPENFIIPVSDNQGLQTVWKRSCGPGCKGDCKGNGKVHEKRKTQNNDYRLCKVIRMDEYSKPLKKPEARHRYWHVQKADREFFPESDVKFKLKFHEKTFELKGKSQGRYYDWTTLSPVSVLGGPSYHRYKETQELVCLGGP